MRLNIGCGNKKIHGYVGVDAVPRSAADIVAPADKIPLDDGAADEILAVHVWEHFYRWECDDVIKEWWRLLKPGGRLCMEMPDMMKTCRNVVENVQGKHPDQMTYWSLWGDPREKDPQMVHKWGWHPASMRDFLDAAGFINIVDAPTQFHGTGKKMRDMRIEATKP